MNKGLSAAANAGLLFGSIVFCLAAAEAGLRLYALRPMPQVSIVHTPAARGGDAIEIPADMLARQRYRHSLVTLPPEWQRRPADVPGAFRAEYWHGALHIYNEDFQRHIGPYPPKRTGIFRVLMLGDSLTYGHAISEDQTYTALLNKWLGGNGEVELLNLGRAGQQSEDILRGIKKFVPELQPDLVFYGVCLNDFLPSGIGEYDDGTAYSIPLPENIKAAVVTNTKLGQLLRDGYDAALRSLRLRKDFISDVLTNFDERQDRFARDVAEMKRFLRASGLPLVVAMVLDQYPSINGTHHQIARIAEAALHKAGARVIPTENYYQANDGKHHYVTRWDGHPDEIANYIWANMIMTWLERNDVLPH